MKKIVLFGSGILFTLIILMFNKFFVYNKGEIADSFTKGVRLSNGNILLVCFEKNPAIKYMDSWGFVCVLNITNELELVAKQILPDALLQNSFFQMDISQSRDEVIIYTDDASSGVRYSVNNEVFCEAPGYRLSKTNVLGHVLHISGTGR